MRYKLHHQHLIKKQFKRALKKTKRKISTSIFDIQYGNNDLGYPRLGIIVSSKKIKKAVTRNLLKRVIRERFRLTQNRLKKIDILVFVKKGAETLTKKELEQQIIKQLEELTL